MDREQILTGDCMDILPMLAAESVQTCVTSPPYWGLRDYGTDSQLGLESTPEEYLARMVAVFREVWRVLKPDGTLWVNMGSSYASSSTNPNRSLQPLRDPACGNGDKEQSGLKDLDSVYSYLCDGCQVALSIRTSGNARPIELASRQREKKVRGIWRSDSAEGAWQFVPDDVQASTTTGSSPPPPVECCHCSNCGACLSVLRSSSRDASLCARRSACIGGTSGTQLSSAGRNQDRESS